MTKYSRRKSDKHPAMRAAVEHPRWTLAGIGTVAGLLPFVVPVLLWLFGFIETTAQGQAREDKLRADLSKMRDEFRTEEKNDVSAIYVNIGKLRQEVEGHWSADARQLAGVLLQLLENRAYVTRNKVNDCNIMRQSKRMTTLEQAACFQYEADYAEAKRRYEMQQTTATQVWQTR